MSQGRSYSTSTVVFVFAIIAAMVIHFSFVLIYSFRGNVPAAITRKVDHYMIPVFHQNWKLFAPDMARYNSELEFRVATNGEWSDWADASAAYGYGSTSTIETIEQNILDNLNWQVLNDFYSKNGIVQFDRIEHSASYTSAMYFVLKMYRNANPKNREEMFQIRIHYRFTPSPGSSEAPAEQSLELPVYHTSQPKPPDALKWAPQYTSPQ